MSGSSKFKTCLVVRMLFYSLINFMCAEPPVLCFIVPYHTKEFYCFSLVKIVSARIVHVRMTEIDKTLYNMTISLIKVIVPMILAFFKELL